MKTKEIYCLIGKKFHLSIEKKITHLKSGNQTDIELLNGNVGLH
jgi:hypothetical protein